MRNQLINLGCKIRDIRKERKMTLQELALQTNLTAGLLSKIENFRTIPSLPVLLDIAKALKVDLSELFEGIVFSEQKNWILVKSGEYQQLERDPEHGFQYQMALEVPLNAANMQVMYVTDKANSKYHPVTTEADQLLYILSGEFSFRVGKDIINLKSGDILFFDGTIPHGPGSNPESHFSFMAFYFLRSAESK